MRFIQPTLPVDRLSCPYGALPGIDPTHPAFVQPFFSSVAVNGVLYNLMTNKPAVIGGGSPLRRADKTIGQSCYATDGDVMFQFTGNPISLTGGSLTAAVIAKLDAINAGGSYLVDISPTANSAIPSVDNLGEFRCFYANTIGNVASGIFLSAGVPYFLCCTYGTVPVQSTMFGVTNLLNGSVRISNVALSSQNGGPAVTVNVGSTTNHAGWQGYLATAMFSQVLISRQNLLNWCYDPWSYWYPQAQQDYVGIYSALPPGGRFVGNLPFLGVG
jgi:hypothetical protein